MGRLGWTLGSVLVACGFLALWQLVADLALVSPVFLPSPSRALSSMIAGLQGGPLLARWLGTVERMVQGWFFASLAGIAIGALIGSSRQAQIYLGPLIEFLRPLPASAIVPPAIAVLGLTDGMVLFVIAFGALWPMLLATIHGFASVEPRLYEVGRILRLSRWQVIRKIALPSSMPDILAGMRLSLTMALVLSVVGEMLAGRSGLGQWILVSARLFRSADLFAGIILLGLTGYASSLLLSAAETRLLRWRAPQ